MEGISSSLADAARKAVLDEYREYVTYGILAKLERNEKRRRILETLSSQELGHFQFLSRFVEVKPSLWRVRLHAYLMALLRLIFGVTFVAKFSERGEQKAIIHYRSMEGLLHGDDLAALQNIIREEEEHEKALISQLDETIVRYMGALVLGLADAIIEITGTHAGTLGTTNNTIVAGVIGLIVGVGAAISMASASYLQTKHEMGKSPAIAALVTGIGYIFAVSLISLPYFLTHNIYLAFGASISAGALLTLLFTFQASVYAEKDFRFEFLQTLGLLLGTAFLTYFIGEWLGYLFGIRGLIGA